MPVQWVTWLSKFVEDQSNKITFRWYQFSELTLEQLYAALKLRAEVFVVEQQCPFLDPDEKDFAALHLLGTQNNQLVAYSRLLLPSSTQSSVIFSRVLMIHPFRRQGYGKQLMAEIFRYCELHYPQIPVECSAQLYLQKFYEGYGMAVCGKVYIEDGILHVPMRRDVKNVD